MTKGIASATFDVLDEDLEKEIVAWRRHLHAHPELGFREHETTRFIREKLHSWGIATELALDTGVIARLGEGYPVLGIRADIDALPIQEEWVGSYASRHPGVMHACGHDGHTAILLGVAKALATSKKKLPGGLRLIFQPAEEVVPGGAKALVASGKLADLDAMIGLHLWSGYETGLISARGGPLMASTDMFKIVIRGLGGHGAYPHQGIDPIVAASAIVTNLQSIVSRNVGPIDACVVSVGIFQSGTAFNVIPPFAELHGTARTLSASVRDTVEHRVRSIAEATARAFGAQVDIEYTRGNPALVNNSGVSDLLSEAGRRTVGEEGVFDAPPMMGGEDFAYYCEAIPSAFALVGARNASLNATFPHHHPAFTIDEAALGIGARLFLEAIDVWTERERVDALVN